MPMVSIDESDYARIVLERDQLAAQVTELQASASKATENARGRRVRAFHVKYGHPVASRPAVLSEDRMRFRLRLIAEEFFELLDASLDLRDTDRTAVAVIEAAIAGKYPYQLAPVRVDLVEVADALEDLDVVIEGTRAELGIDGGPIADEVHRANMSKGPNGPDGKPTKPEGWKGPQVAACLHAQGWGWPLRPVDPEPAHG